MRVYLIAGITLCLAACAGSDRVSQVGKDTYLVSANGSKWDAAASVKADAIDKARKYCIAQGLDLKVISIEKAYVAGYQPQEADVQFQCLAENDPRNHGGAAVSSVSGGKVVE